MEGKIRAHKRGGKRPGLPKKRAGSHLMSQGEKRKAIAKGGKTMEGRALSGNPHRKRSPRPRRDSMAGREEASKRACVLPGIHTTLRTAGKGPSSGKRNTSTTKRGQRLRPGSQLGGSPVTKRSVREKRERALRGGRSRGKVNWDECAKVRLQETPDGDDPKKKSGRRHGHQILRPSKEGGNCQLGGPQ